MAKHKALKKTNKKVYIYRNRDFFKESKMKKKPMILLLAFIMLLALLFATYKLMNARTFQVIGTLINKVETEEKVVALTFDDGPTEHTDEILSTLKKYDIKATFFLIGNEIEKNSEEAKKIMEAGHQIGNHTFSHERMIFKTPSFVKEELEKTNQFIREIGYEGEIDFRPPNGKKLIVTPYYVNKMGMDTITWNLEPDTYYTEPEDKINYVKDNVEEGSIILFHPMYDETGKELKAIEGTIKELVKDGYKFVTVSELKQMR